MARLRRIGVGSGKSTLARTLCERLGVRTGPRAETARLDVLVWLDHPRALTMARVITRTLERRVGVRLRGQRQVDRWLTGPVSASLGGC